MFRRARLSVKPNVRPGVGARCSTAPNAQRGKVAHPQRGKEALRPPEPAAACDPKPAEPTNVPLVDFGRAEPQKEAPRSSDEKTDGENDVEESSKFSFSVSQRRKRISSTPTLVKPSVNVPSETHPLSTVNQEAPQPNPIPTKEKRPCSDRHRIYKAQKLREMLKEELRREKKQWKNKYAINESQRPQDRSKMTMRDFIYYLPDKNPMTSSLEQEKKTEKSLIPVQTREQEDRSTPDPEDNEELEEEMDDGPLLVPRVKVAEDGSIILDEESLTVEVLRTKGSCVVEDNDPIFERGSTTTYSSFRKNYYSKPWSNKETDMFFLAISMVGTDFSMIGQLFPHRARIEIKNKFKREEKTNGWRIDKAFQEKRPFDFDFFAHLLQKVLAEEEKRKQKFIKNQSLKEKKSSKLQKNVKVKNVATEGVNDNPDESESANISDTEESQNDAQTVQEEQGEQPLMLSEEDSEHIALEPDLSQKKRRRKSRDEVGKEEIKDLTRNATVQPGPSKEEKQKNKCQSLRLEVNEDEGKTKQKLACVQNISELVDVSSSVEVVNSSDPVLSSRKTDQTENVQSMEGEELQRPKHNLSRAVGKKFVLSQGKTDGRSTILHSETSIEKVHMEKDRMDSFDISGTENSQSKNSDADTVSTENSQSKNSVADTVSTENSQSKNSEADTVSNLSGKVSTQKDDPLKAFRPLRLTSGRQQRPRPNVGQAAERKEILASQEEIGANVEKNESKSCSDKDTPGEIEDLSYKNFESEGIIIISQSEDNNTFQTVQPDEPKCVNERLSTQEDNKANMLKPVPVLKNRFQKPKPNIGRRTRRRMVSSKEEVPEDILLASGEKTAARVEMSLKDHVPGKANTTEEVESESKEIGRGDSSHREKIPAMVDTTVVETDLKETGRKISPKGEIPGVTDTIEEIQRDSAETGGEISLQESAPEEVSTVGEVESDLAGTERNELSLQESAPEVSTVGEVETGLKGTGREISPRDEIPEVTGAIEEIETDLTETGGEISLQESAPKEVSTVGEVESDLAETERNELSLQESAPEVSTVGEVETGLKGTGREISPRDEIPEVTGTIEEIETDLTETGGEISLQESAPEVSTVGEVESDLTETERNELSLQESAPEASTVGEVETGLKGTGREISPRDEIPEGTDAIEEIQTDLTETERNELSLQESAPEEVSTAGEVKKGLKEIEKEIPSRQNILVGISAIQERENNLKENGKGDIFLMEKVSEKMAAIRVTEKDLKETGRSISLNKSGSEEISATEEMVADLKKTGTTDISSRKNEPKKTGTSLQTGTDLMQSSDADCNAAPSLNVQNISSEVLSVVHTTVEEKRNSEKKTSSQLSHLKTSLQTSEIDKIEEQETRSTGVPELFSDINLSKSLHQEQKPSEVKPAPFVRSRFKKPKPNLSRAAVKRVTTDAEKHVPGKKLEMDKMVTTVVRQDDEQMNTLPSQHDVSSLMTSREKDRSTHRQEDAVILSCVQTEKILSPSSSCEANEESRSALAQEKESLVSVGSHDINTSQQGRKESVPQTARPGRGRFQRPRPNVRKAEQRQMIGKGEAKGIIKEEKTILQKEEAKKFMTVENSEIGTEIEVVPSKVPEGRMYKNQNHVALVENLHVNKINVLDKKMRHEDNVYVPSPAQLISQFQEAKPNLGRAHDKKEEPGIEKDRANQSEARKSEDNLLQQGDSVTQLLQKGKDETSLEVSARKDYVGSKEAGLAKKDAQSEVGPSGSVGQKTVGGNSLSSVVEERQFGKLASHLQLLKQSNCFKIAQNRRTANSSASGYEIHQSERRMHRKIKPNVTKGRGAKRIRSKTSKKEPRTSRTMLVTLRASQEEYEDDVEDFESDYEDETYHLAPEEVNKAPVFVPVGLRSPEPVSAQIEETMEELEITVNAPDIGFITVDEHQLSNTEVTPQEMKQEENFNALSVDMSIGEHTQIETDINDGSTEAAITLLTMGDLVLQSEISTEPSDVGVSVLLDVYSKDKSHIPFNPDNVNHKIVHECQELSSPVISTPPSSSEENKIVLEEQSAKEKIVVMEKVKEKTTSTRNTTSDVTNNLRTRSRFVKPKPNLSKILGTNRMSAHQELPSLFVTKGKEVEIQRETEQNALKATGLEDENLGSVTTAERKEQSRLAHVHGVEETNILQEASLTERKEDQEQGSQEVQLLSFAPTVSSETNSHTLGSDRELGENSVGESWRKDLNEDTVLTLYVPECTPTSIPEVQPESIISPQDLAANLVGNVHRDDEDEEAFILTLVEIPTNAVEEFTDTTTQLMPNPFLPAPILVKSVTAEEKGDMSMSFPVTSVGQDAVCLSNSGYDDSEKSSINMDPISRKRFHCRLDESDHVPLAKKSLLASRGSCQKYTSEVCSKELINIFEETGKSYKGQDTFSTLGSTYTTPEPQKEQLEPTLQSTGYRSLVKRIDTHTEKTVPQSPQDKMIVSDKEEPTCTASKSEQVESITSSPQTLLSRPRRRPLGFLSLICSKNSLESDEPTHHVRSKKRLKPHIPASRQNLKRSKPRSEGQKTIKETSDLPPSLSVGNTQSENIGSSATQVSSDRSLPKEECKRVQRRVLEAEPTTVSEYFFNDIFIEVDEIE
ncbi:transcription factor TFIIIB component B'' homolog [Rhynchonycteris naso]